MKLSFGTRVNKLESIRKHNGYGYATDCMLGSLNRLGYEINPNDPTADAEIWFDQPPAWKFSKGVYRIGYHPWESTRLIKGWAEIMNECDEIWTPSPLIADWYRRFSGITVPVYVYQHGVEHAWSPVRRNRDDVIKFLHVGTEATRKGGWETVNAFRRAFPNRTDVSLTMKMVASNWNGIPRLGRTTYINELYDFDQLQRLFYDHHVYVYPSHGEGFGLTPLQAIATGMPTITVPAWAPYHEFLDERLNVPSKLVVSPWEKIHPGKILRPDFDEVVDRMRFAADNYDDCVDSALTRTDAIHEFYDWDRLTAEAFEALERRLKENR
jgi:glycosyltransferase involved in cell wall biosynthesis